MAGVAVLKLQVTQLPFKFQHSCPQASFPAKFYRTECQLARGRRSPEVTEGAPD